MINSNELREGNYLNDYKGLPGQCVFGLGGFDIANRLNGYSASHEGSAIPLTEQNIERSGFKIDNSDPHRTQATIDIVSYGVYKTRFRLSNNIAGLAKGEWWLFIDGVNPTVIPKKIKFLHDLQNQIFYCSGTELTITL